MLGVIQPAKDSKWTGRFISASGVTESRGQQLDGKTGKALKVLLVAGRGKGSFPERGGMFQSPQMSP